LASFTNNLPPVCSNTQNSSIPSSSSESRYQLRYWLHPGRLSYVELGGFGIDPRIGGEIDLTACRFARPQSRLLISDAFTSSPRWCIAPILSSTSFLLIPFAMPSKPPSACAWSRTAAVSAQWGGGGAVPGTRRGACTSGAAAPAAHQLRRLVSLGTILRSSAEASTPSCGPAPPSNGMPTGAITG
jgi:hypothetical protein